jgi:hypothetical protein
VDGLDGVGFHAVALQIPEGQVVLDGELPQLGLLQQGLKFLPGLLQALHRPLDQVGIDKDHILRMVGFAGRLDVLRHGGIPRFSSGCPILYQHSRPVSTWAEKGGRTPSFPVSDAAVQRWSMGTYACRCPT